MIQRFLHLRPTQKTWAAPWWTSSSQSTWPVGTNFRPQAGEFLPRALWLPSIHQHNYTQVLSGQRQQFLFGLPATALQRDIFTVRILIQGNKDKPLQL